MKSLPATGPWRVRAMTSPGLRMQRRLPLRPPPRQSRLRNNLKTAWCSKYWNDRQYSAFSRREDFLWAWTGCCRYKNHALPFRSGIRLVQGLLAGLADRPGSFASFGMDEPEEPQPGVGVHSSTSGFLSKIHFSFPIASWPDHKIKPAISACAPSRGRGARDRASAVQNPRYPPPE
jgi:hypothetical protein